LVCASKVYSGLGADIVMESFRSLTRFPANKPRKLVLSPVGVEKVTSISRMRISGSMLEESIRSCSV
jgi:hypothetical protein